MSQRKSSAWLGHLPACCQRASCVSPPTLSLVCVSWSSHPVLSCQAPPARFGSAPLACSHHALTIAGEALTLEFRFEGFRRGKRRQVTTLSCPGVGGFPRGVRDGLPHVMALYLAILWLIEAFFWGGPLGTQELHSVTFVGRFQLGYSMILLLCHPCSLSWGQPAKITLWPAQFTLGCKRERAGAAAEQPTRLATAWALAKPTLVLLRVGGSS